MMSTGLEILEPRQLLSVTLTNGLPASDPGHYSVVLDAGGTTHNVLVGDTDTIYDYIGYLEAGGEVFELGAHASEPVSTGAGKAHSEATLTIPGGGQVQVAIDSEIPDGTQSLVNTYVFTATGFDLRTAKFFQYMDSDIESISDDILTVAGSIAEGDLILTTIDQATSVRQIQIDATTGSGGHLSGFGADQYSQLQSAIVAGGYDAAPEGTIDTDSLTPGNFPGWGAGYGPEDVTTTLEYAFDDAASATITTTLGYLVPTYTAPVLIVPDFLGSLPHSSQDLTAFLTALGTDPADLGPERILDNYGSILSTFDEQLNYELGADLFFAGYDWRLPIAPEDGSADGLLELDAQINFDDSTYDFAVEYLDYWIRQARAQWDSAGNPADEFKVDIIAHGMGGIVTRALIQSDYFAQEYGDIVSHVVTLGTPHEGTAAAFLHSALGLDEVTTDAHKVLAGDVYMAQGIFDLFIDMARASGVSQAELNHWTDGLDDLLPTGDFITASSQGTPPPAAQVRNDLLLDLNADTAQFFDHAGQVTFVRTNSELTNAGVRYGVDTAITTSTASGDGVVTGSSAFLADGNEGVDRTVTHRGITHANLLSDADVQRDLIVDSLDLRVPKGFQPATQPRSAVNWVLGYFKPADFVVTDAEGKRVGNSQATGVVNEIPGAYYSGEGAIEYFFIPVTTTTGDLNVQLTGVGGGNYQGNITYAVTGLVGAQDYQGALAAGQTTSFIHHSPLPEDLAGNTRWQATSLGDLASPRSILTDYVGPMDVNDFYSFTLNQKRTVSIQLHKLDQDAVVILQNKRGRVIAASRKRGLSVQRFAQELRRGSYIIRVVGKANLGTTYTLTVKRSG
jgi:hypothetical protein